MDEQQLREAAADLRRKATEAAAKGYKDLIANDAAERLEHYADQMKADREAVPEVTKSIQSWFAKARKQ